MSDAEADPKSLLRSYLSGLPTPTAVQSAIATLSRLILLYTTRHLRCSHLVLGTTLTSLSISLINSIAQGGGAHISEESYEEWYGGPRSLEFGEGSENGLGVRIVRPLRDVGMKECAAWAHWRGLMVPGKTSYPELSAKQTIGGLTKSKELGLAVSSLQKDI